MFDGLRQEIEGLEIPVDDGAVLEVCRLSALLAAKVVEAVGEFDEAGLWAVGGAPNMTSWMVDRSGLSRSDCIRKVKRARCLRQLPVTAAAERSGSLTPAQVDVVLGKLDRHTLALFAEHEADVVPALAGL